MNTIRWRSPGFALAVLLLTASAGVPSSASLQQTTSTTQPKTGRAYSSPEINPRTRVAAPRGPSPVAFTDVTRAAGVTFKHAASSTAQKYLLETMGGGVGMLDYDNDGRLDLFFTNGARLNDPMTGAGLPDKREPAYWNRLFHQKPDGSFEDATERAGLRGEGYSMGVACADYDNDGWVDIYVTGYAGNILYHNDRNGTFSNATRKAGVGAGGWSSSAAWLDFDCDGRLDLFVARYLDWDFQRGAMFCGDTRPGMRAYCHPENFKGATNLLYRQRADGTFEDVSKAAGIADPAGKALGVAVADFDLDGWPDIAVANDSVRQSLYRNRRNGTFEDIALSAAVAYDENGRTFAGMGIDAADYDEDGYPDIFITALSNETYPLFRNQGDRTFTYETTVAGIAQATLPYSGWGTRFVDVDNDGLRDIFVAQGHVLDTIEKTSSSLTYRQPLLLLRNTGKGFITIVPSEGSAFTTPVAARGAAVGDLNNDGQPDIVAAVLDSAPVVIRNGGTKNHWIGFNLVGSKSNRNGLGARIVVTDAAGRKRGFDVSTAGSYLSSNDPRVLIGLGTATSVRAVEIRWPGNRSQVIEAPAIDQYHVVAERSAER